MDKTWVRVAEVRCFCGKPAAVLISDGRELKRERPELPQRPEWLPDGVPLMFAPRSQAQWCREHHWQLRPQDRRRALQDARQAPSRWKPRSLRGVVPQQ